MTSADPPQTPGSQIGEPKPGQTQQSVAGPAKAAPPPRSKPGRMPLFRKQASGALALTCKLWHQFSNA